MRCVTAKPPNMLIVASAMRDRGQPRIQASGRSQPPRRERRRDLHQRADDDDAADRVGHAHQRRVQRGRHVPDHHVADEAGEHEHREVREERGRRVGADERGTGPPPTPNTIAGVPRGHRLAAGAVAVAFGGRRRRCRLGRRGRRRRELRRRRRPGDLALLDDGRAADDLVLHVDVDSVAVSWPCSRSSVRRKRLVAYSVLDCFARRLGRSV